MRPCRGVRGPTECLSQQERDHGSGHEPSHVSAPGDVGGRFREELGEEPVDEYEVGRQRDREDEEQAVNPGAGPEDQIRPHHPGDGSGGADHGCGGAGVEQHLREHRDDTREEVEGEISDVAEPVLDVVAEDPQEQHVEAEVQPRSVEKHGREDREIHVLGREERLVASDHRPGVRGVAAVAGGYLGERERVARRQLARYGRVLVEKAVLAVDVLKGVTTPWLNQREHEDVRRDEQQGDDWSASGGVEVSEGNDHRASHSTGVVTVYRFTGGR